MSARQAQATYDEVVRLAEFRLAHPEVSIEHKSAPYWYWTATWTDAAGKERTLVSRDLLGHSLRTLMNGLHKAFGEESGRLLEGPGPAPPALEVLEAAPAFCVLGLLGPGQVLQGPGDPLVGGVLPVDPAAESPDGVREADQHSQDRGEHREQGLEMRHDADPEVIVSVIYPGVALFRITR